MFTNAGKNRVRDLLDTDVTHGQLGSGTTAASLNDTSLVSAVAATSLAVTTETADKQITIDYNLPSTTAAGSTFAEFGLFNASNTLLSREVFSSLVHESTEQWQLSTRYFMD